MLHIKNLEVQTNDKTILKNLFLNIHSGETHAIIGPNGSGKSTLAKTLIGHPLYKITKGQIVYQNFDLTKLSIEERSKNGIFLAFQAPLEIANVSMLDFLNSIYNQKSKLSGQKPLTTLEFFAQAKQLCNELHIEESFLYRSLNDNFSGGEKKKSEILQMLLLKPEFLILDELDSGLDLDALKLLYLAISKYKVCNPKVAILIITHNFGTLKSFNINAIHLMKEGQIVEEGNKNLLNIIEKEGYGAKFFPKEQ